jgi:hypothetical protein
VVNNMVDYNLRSQVSDKGSISVKYSDKGREMSTDILDEASKCGSWKGGWGILHDGFVEIARSDETTDFEKEMAILAVDVNDKIQSTPDAINANYSMMKSIRSTPSGSPGEVLAETMYNASKNTGCWDSKKVLLKEGFESTLEDPAVSSSKKELSEFGLKLIRKSFPKAVNTPVTMSIMKAVCSPVPGSAAFLLGDIFEEAIQTNENYYDTAKIVKSGLDTIASSKHSTPVQTELAELGAEVLDGMNGATDSSLLGVEFMKAIAEVDEITENTIPEIFMNAADSCSKKKPRNSILKNGLEVIEKSPYTNDNQKALASGALKAVAKHEDKEHLADETLKFTMQKILELSGGSVSKENVMPRSSVVVKDNCVVINGVKVPRKNRVRGL